VKIIAADRGKENKGGQTPGKGGIRQQPAGLPDHKYRAQRNIKAAENKKVNYFSKHFVMANYAMRPT
jgi:hypothetical protein